MNEFDKVPPLVLDGAWNATEFFSWLANHNNLALKEDFKVVEVSGLHGLSSLLATAIDSPNIIAVEDVSEGYAEILDTPSRKMVKSVFITMAHAPLDLEARRICFDIEREIFRQFMSVVIKERTRLLNNNISLGKRISFNEIEKDFAQGAACAWFSLEIDIPLDLRFRTSEWSDL